MPRRDGGHDIGDLGARGARAVRGVGGRRGKRKHRLGLRLGQLEISRFSNDNLRVQIQENVRERDVFVVQSFTEPVSEHIMELMITLDALRSASAQR